MKQYILVPVIVFSMVGSGCSDMPQLGGGPKYGDSSGSGSNQNDRYGKITALEVVQVDQNYKFGIGTAVGAVAGGLLGSQIGKGDGSTLVQCWVRRPVRSRGPRLKAR